MSKEETKDVDKTIDNLIEWFNNHFLTEKTTE